MLGNDMMQIALASICLSPRHECTKTFFSLSNGLVLHMEWPHEVAHLMMTTPSMQLLLLADTHLLDCHV